MEKSKNGSSWATFILVFLCGCVFAISFFKVPGAMVTLMEHFGVSAAEAGWFMSWCSVAGTLIAFVTGAIQTKIGPKGMIILALVFTALDSLVGVLAGTNVTLFYVSRFIGGLGNGCLATGGPVLIALLFKDPAKRALPNSIWACWTAVGSLIILNAFAFLIQATGSWQGVWWVVFAVTVVFLIIAVFGIRMDKDEMMAAVATSGDVKPWSGLTDLNTWLLVIVFAAFAFIYSCWSAMSPTFGVVAVGMDMAAANSASSITTITGIVGSLIMGVVLAKVRNQPAAMVVATVICAVVGVIMFLFTSSTMFIVMAVLCGLLVNIVPPCCFSNAQWVSDDPVRISLCMAALPIGSNFGGIPASPIIGMYADAGNWAGSALPLAVVGVVMVVCAIVFTMRCGRRAVAGTAQGQGE